MNGERARAASFLGGYSTGEEGGRCQLLDRVQLRVGVGAGVAPAHANGESGQVRRPTITVVVSLTAGREVVVPQQSGSGTGVLFRHYGFGAGYPELDLGHTAQTWAMITDRFVQYASSGTPNPFFPA
jgi:hypothetical protein